MLKIFLKNVGNQKSSADYESSTHNLTSAIKVCPVCNKEFHPNTKFSSTQRYCNECKNKYSFSELAVLSRINEGYITQGLSNKIFKLLSKGKSKSDIVKSLDLGYLSIDCILKFLPPNEDKSFQVNNKNSKLLNESKICEFCGDEFYPNTKFSSTQRYCNDCRLKYNTFEMTAIKNILSGIFTEEIYERIIELEHRGMSKKDISKELSISPVSLINPIIKFLGPNSEEIPTKIIDNFAKKGLKIKYEKQEAKPVVPFEVEDEIEIDVFGEYYEDSVICPVCGLEFYPKHPSQEYCENCTSKYSASEREVLNLITDGTIDKIISNEIKRLRDKGYSDRDIARKLDFESPIWVKHIVKFLPPDSIFDDVENRVCPICHSKFIVKPYSNQKYCFDCRSKYSVHDLEALTLINTGKIIENTSNKMNDLLNEGISEEEVAKRFNLRNVKTIKSIFKFLPPNNNSSEIKEDNNLKICSACGNSFLSVNGAEYCTNCRYQYNDDELFILSEIKSEGITQEDSNNISRLLREGNSKKYICSEYNLEKYAYIDCIFKFLPPKDKFDPINQSNEFDNVSSTKPYKSLKIKRHSGYINVVLEGIISNKDRFALFTRSSFLDEFNLNYIECKKVGKYFEINIDLSFRENEAKSHINKFKAMGWVEK